MVLFVAHGMHYYSLVTSSSGFWSCHPLEAGKRKMMYLKTSSWGWGGKCCASNTHINYITAFPHTFLTQYKFSIARFFSHFVQPNNFMMLIVNWCWVIKETLVFLTRNYVNTWKSIWIFYFNNNFRNIMVGARMHTCTHINVTDSTDVVVRRCCRQALWQTKLNRNSNQLLIE